MWLLPTVPLQPPEYKVKMADSISLSICSAVSLEKPLSPGQLHPDQQSQQYVKP